MNGKLRKSKNVKLYNVIFPFWFLILVPQMWLIVLPGNFIIDSIVLLVSMMILKIDDRKQKYKKYILKIFLFGMLSDVIGSAFLFVMLITEVSSMGDEIYITIPAIIISAVLIYVFNYFFTFKKAEVNFRRKMSLIFAIVTAPYTFLIPTTWLY